eukprot:3941144-Rhodomonas_salina.1
MTWYHSLSAFIYDLVLLAISPRISPGLPCYQPSYLTGYLIFCYLACICRGILCYLSAESLPSSEGAVASEAAVLSLTLQGVSASCLALGPKWAFCALRNQTQENRTLVPYVQRLQRKAFDLAVAQDTRPSYEAKSRGQVTRPSHEAKSRGQVTRASGIHTPMPAVHSWTLDVRYGHTAASISASEKTHRLAPHLRYNTIPKNQIKITISARRVVPGFVVVVFRSVLRCWASRSAFIADSGVQVAESA